MNVGIITFEQYNGKKYNSIGSSRIRMNSMLSYWPEAENFKHGKKYDVLIFQKAYWLEMAREFTGIKILDICDPDFLDWHYNIKEMADLCDAVVTSTEKLADSIVRFVNVPVWVIPDRVDVDGTKNRKEHYGEAKKAVWFGYSQNFPLLDQAAMAMGKYGLELIVIADNVYIEPASVRGKFKLTNYSWSVDTVDEDIKKADMVLNPRMTSGHWAYKSNNKSLHSWNLGLPVANSDEEIKHFLSEENRRTEVSKKLVELKEKWDIKLSVKEYKDLINDLT